MNQYTTAHKFQLTFNEPNINYITGSFSPIFDKSDNITNPYMPDSSRLQGIKYFNFVEKISKFSKLQANWDSYNADPISQNAITTALETIDFLNNQGFLSSGISINVFPMRDGGIQFEFDSVVICAELEINANGELTFILFDDEGNIKVENQLFELLELSALLDE